MTRRLRWAWGLLAAVVLLTGCKRVEDEKTVNLEENAPAGLMVIPAQTKDMKVTLTATSPGVPVTLYLVPTADADQMMTDLDHKKESSTIIAKSSPGETVTLEATQPANKDCTVVGISDKKAEVKVKVVGRY